MSRRIERLSKLLQEKLAYLLQKEIRDPRISGIVSITKVSITPDIRNAYVFVSIIGDEEKKKLTMEGLNSASGFLRHQLAIKLTWRRMPQLHFKWDDSLEQGANVLKLIDEVSK